MPRERDRFEIPEEPRGPENHGDWLTRQAIRALHSDAREYELVTEGVRRNFDDVHASITRLLDANKSDPMLRWSALHVLADAADERGVDLLRREALRRVRVPEPKKGICEHPAELEELVVIMAIEGLGSVAARGQREATRPRGRGESKAVDALFEVLRRQPSRTLRGPAVAALLAADPSLRGKVADALPEEERYLVDLRFARQDDVTVTPPDQERSDRPTRRERGRKPRAERGRQRPIIQELEDRSR